MQKHTAHCSLGLEDDHEDDEDGGGDDNDDDQFACHSMRTKSFFFLNISPWSIMIRLQYECSRLFGALTPKADQTIEDAQYPMTIIPS